MILWLVLVLLLLLLLLVVVVHDDGSFIITHPHHGDIINLENKDLDL
jgi:hypothetical protein